MKACYKCNQPGHRAPKFRPWPASEQDNDPREGMRRGIPTPGPDLPTASTGGVWIMAVGAAGDDDVQLGAFDSETFKVGLFAGPGGGSQ